jgi:hypothetical protein
MRKMKTKLLITLCIMIFAGAIMVGPVLAADATSTITANITQVLTLQVTGTSITGWALNQGENYDANSVTLNLTSNYPAWVITVYDALNTAGENPKNTTTQGKMAQSTAGGAYIGDYNLTNPMRFTGTTDPLHYTGSLNVTSESPKEIYRGLTDYRGAGNFPGMPIRIDQLLIISDPVLNAGQLYKIIVTFTAYIP